MHAGGLRVGRVEVKCLNAEVYNDHRLYDREFRDHEHHALEWPEQKILIFAP